MAKKKLTHEAKNPKEEAPQPQDHQGNKSHQTHQSKTTMQDSTEKLQNLKNLNSLLLKETFERRQQVESLVQAKESLETEITQFGMEKQLLVDDLNRASQENVGLELEKFVIYVFLETQIGEMGFEIEKMKKEKDFKVDVLEKKVSELVANLENEREFSSRVCRERDGIKRDVEVLVEEVNGLRENVVVMEEKERNLEEEGEKVKMKYERLMAEKMETEREIEAAKREKDLVEMNLVKAVNEIEDLKEKIEVIVRDKNDIEKEKCGQEVKIGELEKEIRELNETEMNLRKEAVVLRSKVLELEKSIGETMEKEKEMVMEINMVVEEKRALEDIVEMLRNERNSLKKTVGTVTLELDRRGKEMEEIVREKNEIEEVKVSQESEIVGLHKEVGGLRNAVFALQESFRNEEEKNKKLQDEIGCYKDDLNRVMLERESVQKGFEEEMKKVMSLRLKIVEMEKNIEETEDELRREVNSLTDRKREMECHFEMLVDERDMAQKRLLEAEGRIEKLRAKVESTRINSEQKLALLKNTAALVCPSKDGRDGREEVAINGQKLDDEIKPYAVELETIKNAFRNNETVVEDMKKQLEFLQNSVVEAHKKKNFWTAVSSAVTVLAAASVAYVARAH